MADTKMIVTATRRYGTRSLQAGEEITLNGPRARLAAALGIAKPAPDKPAEDLSDLRSRYATVVGKRPFHKWDAKALQAKIAEAEAQ